MSWDEIASLYYKNGNGETGSGEALRSKFKKYRKANDVTNKSIVVEKDTIVRNEKIILENANNRELIIPTHINNYKESTEFKQDGSQISDKLLSMSENESKDPDFVLRSHGYSPSEWVITSAKNSMWHMNTKEDGIRTLFSSKISVKPRTEILLNEDNITKILDNLIKNYSIPSLKQTKQTKHNPSTNGNLLILNIADLHYGLKSYLETSNNEYEDVIATNRFFYVINDVISRIKHREIDKIILLNLGDICNFAVYLLWSDMEYQNYKYHLD